MRELGRLLRTFCHQNQTRWFNFIKEINELLNAVQHETTGVSPNEIIFGKSVKLPVDKLLKKLFPNLGENEKEICVEQIRKMHLSRAEKRRKAYDRFIKNAKFKIGDLVLIKTHFLSRAEAHYSKKLDLLFSGPYKIIKFPYTNVVELATIEGVRKGNYNYAELKKYVPLE